MTSTEILEKYWGFTSFRGNQEEAISNFLEGKNLVYIEKTGGGKSVCYQIPAIAKGGLTIVISPLKSLMKDQVESLERKGVKATYLNSDLKSDEYNERYQGILDGEYNLLYLSPEKLATEGFRKTIIRLASTITSFIIDEFDTVDEYGSTGFRPEFLELGEIHKEIETEKGEKIPVGIFTATATEGVIEQVAEMMGVEDNYIKYKGKLIGDNLKLQVKKFESKSDKDNYLLGLLKKIKREKDGVSVIFCSTTKNVDNLYKLLKDKGFNIGRYHGQMTTMLKNSAFKKFLENKIDFIVCTNAFGRGVDKGDIRNVIHYGIPGNVSSYLQEVGRGGRDQAEFIATTLYSQDDIRVRKFIQDFSQHEELEKLTDLLDNDECYLQSIENYFEYPERASCSQCSNCIGDLIEIDEDKLEDFTVKKVKRKKRRKVKKKTKK